MKYLFSRENGKNIVLRCACGSMHPLTRQYYCSMCFQYIFKMDSDIIHKDIRKDSVFIEREDLDVYIALEKL